MLQEITAGCITVKKKKGKINIDIYNFGTDFLTNLVQKFGTNFKTNFGTMLGTFFGTIFNENYL